MWVFVPAKEEAPRLKKERPGEAPPEDEQRVEQRVEQWVVRPAETEAPGAGAADETHRPQPGATVAARRGAAAEVCSQSSSSRVPSEGP